MSINIRTQFDRFQPGRRTAPSEAGSPMKMTYTTYYDASGLLVFEEDQPVNLYEEIQSHHASCDIHTLIERFHRGDPDIIRRLQSDPGSYTDVTGMPTTYQEVLNLIHQGEDVFNKLPLNVRAQFDHDFHQWLASMDDLSSWRHRMGFDELSSTVDKLSDAVSGVSTSTQEVSSNNDA